MYELITSETIILPVNHSPRQQDAVKLLAASFCHSLLTEMFQV
jgi:hypothetical protein